MARLIVKGKGEQPDRIVELKPGINRIGSARTNEVVLSRGGAAKIHCEIKVQNDFIFVRNLDAKKGILLNDRAVNESTIYSGQTLKVGSVEMILDAPPIKLVLPEIKKAPKVSVEEEIELTRLADGHEACLEHPKRHAAWKCVHCTRVFCEDCVRKVGRSKGLTLRMCPSCGRYCQPTDWCERICRDKNIQPFIPSQAAD